VWLAGLPVGLSSERLAFECSLSAVLLAALPPHALPLHPVLLGLYGSQWPS
jgi:hypothetical protein